MNNSIFSGLSVCVCLVDLSLAIYNRYFSGDGGDESVGYAAHLGGGLAGILIGMNVLRNFKTKKWEGYLRMVCWLLWCACISSFILVNCLAGDGFYPESDHSKISECVYRPGCLYYNFGKLKKY